MRTLAKVKGAIFFIILFCFLFFLHIQFPKIEIVKIPSKNSWNYEIQGSRIQKIREICDEFSGDGIYNENYYQGRAPNYEQKLNLQSFLIAEKPKTVYCFNFKAAASTWMSTFAKLLHDEEYFKVF